VYGLVTRVALNLERRSSFVQYEDGKSSNKELMYLSLALLAAPLRVPGVARMSLPINNPCPMLPPPVSSSELETVTLGMG
jgi:hypothetical protein